MSAITAYTAVPSPLNANDVLPIVDVTDLSMSAQGTTKKVTVQQLHDFVASPAAPLPLSQGGTAQSVASSAALLTALGAAAIAGVTFTGAVIMAVVNLSQSGGNVAVNAALGNDFRLTLTASGWTIANATNPVDGQKIEFELTQDATGSRTVVWGSAYDFGAAGTPTLSTGANKVDVIQFKYLAALSKWAFRGAFLGN